MFISKRKVISVLADSVAVCDINIECAKKDKSKYGLEWFNYYRDKQISIRNEILIITRHLNILSKVVDKSNHIFDKWEKKEVGSNEKNKI